MAGWVSSLAAKTADRRSGAGSIFSNKPRRSSSVPALYESTLSDIFVLVSSLLRSSEFACLRDTTNIRACTRRDVMLDAAQKAH